MQRNVPTCIYCGKIGDADTDCYMEPKDAKVCEYCRRVGHTREKEYWAEENDNWRRRPPPREDVQDRPSDDGVHMITESSEHVAQIKRSRDGHALPKQVAMDV